MSFSNQALSVLYIHKNKGALPRRVLRVPREIDEEVAKRKLESMNIKIEELTEEQKRYLESWRV
jgi:adenosylhomocysteinase